MLSRGNSVRFAGRLKFNRNGELVQIDNHSGHYLTKPGVGLTDKAKAFLMNEGLDVSKAIVVEVGR